MRKPVPDLDARIRLKLAAETVGLVAGPVGPDDAHDPGAWGMAKKTGKAKPRGDRWATLNQFVDVIAPRLSGAEVRVWLFMFRHARGGVIELSERMLAKAAGVSKETAGLALRRLVAVGLAWEVFKSGVPGHGSKYGLRPNPASKLAAVEAARESDRRAGNRTPKKRKRAGGKSAR